MAYYIQEEAKKNFQEMMEKLLENPPPKLMQKLASAMSNAATHVDTVFGHVPRTGRVWIGKIGQQ